MWRLHTKIDSIQNISTDGIDIANFYFIHETESAASADKVDDVGSNAVASSSSKKKFGVMKKGGGKKMAP